MHDILTRYRGALVGVGVGDALGAPVEFMTKYEIREKHGILTVMTGGGVWNTSPGEVTDDTHMTIAVAKGILEAPEDPVDKVARYFVDWAKTEPPDIGRICKLVLQEGIRIGADTEEKWLKVAEQAHYISGQRSAGNGSLMRTIPVVLGYFPDRARMVSLARRISALTHYDDIAGQCVEFYCEIVRKLLSGRNLHEVLKEAQREAPITLDLSVPVAELNTSGYVVHTLQAALTSAYQTQSFEDALITAVNLGGDTDTIGAVTGGLAGAYYGFDSIPIEWVDALVVKDELLALAEDLMTLAITDKP